jgi:hypothetical protein
VPAVEQRADRILGVAVVYVCQHAHRIKGEAGAAGLPAGLAVVVIGQRGLRRGFVGEFVELVLHDYVVSCCSSVLLKRRGQ